MKKVLSLLVFVVCLGGCMEGVKQKVVPFLDMGYSIDTYVWINDELVWSHYTFQDWSSGYGRLYIPIDSIEQVKKRDYETAKKVYSILKSNKYQKY